MVLKLPPASMAIIVMAMAMVMAMVMVTVATILLTRRDNVVRPYKENPAANIAVGFFCSQAWLLMKIKKAARDCQDENTRENNKGNHRWLRQRHDKLDADQAVGNNANDAADEGGVDDVPLSPENTTENCQADEDAEDELVGLC